MMRRLTIVAFVVAMMIPGAAAIAGPNACDTRTNNTYTKLLECLTAEGVFEHQQALQDIADNADNPFYPGTRAAGTDAYADSVDYVASHLEAAGWNVTLDPVEATFTFPAVLNQLTPIAAEYETGAFTGSGAGEVEGVVVPIDLALDDPASSTSGCEPGDFPTAPSEPSIALVQRGACFFSVKAVNAEAAGYDAVVIFNQGNSDTRMGLIVANAANLPDGSPSNIGIPVVGASFADGVALSQDGSTAYIEVRPSETRIDYNVIAELPGENTDNVVMAGAHLDSVVQGPGIQDNGSGSAALLELALLMSKAEPVNTLRFGWWAAEEQGLVGSASYVNNLPADELDRIAAYLNFDMIASPNFIYGVYDADESSFAAPVPVPDGSEALEDLFEIYFTWQGIPYEDTQFSGRSDYQAFINNGIPASGLFTGAEVPKTDAQVAIWGGVAGAQYDPCYHLACDSAYDDDPQRDPAVYDVLNSEFDMRGNVNLTALGNNSDAVAFAVLTLAYSTEAVNGVPGKMVPGSPSLNLPTEPAGPEGTVGSGGGLDHEHDADE